MKAIERLIELMKDKDIDVVTIQLNAEPSQQKIFEQLWEAAVAFLTISDRLVAPVIVFFFGTEIALLHGDFDKLLNAVTLITQTDDFTPYGGAVIGSARRLPGIYEDRKDYLGVLFLLCVFPDKKQLVRVACIERRAGTLKFSQIRHIDFKTLRDAFRLQRALGNFALPDIFFGSSKN